MALVLLVAATFAAPRGGHGLEVAAVLLLLGMLVLSGAYLLAAGAGRLLRQRPVASALLICVPFLFAASLIWATERSADPGPARRAACGVDSCATDWIGSVMVTLLLGEAVLLMAVVTGFAVQGVAGLGALLVVVGANCISTNRPLPGYVAYFVGVVLAGAPWLPGLSRVRWRTDSRPGSGHS